MVFGGQVTDEEVESLNKRSDLLLLLQLVHHILLFLGFYFTKFESLFRFCGWKWTC